MVMFQSDYIVPISLTSSVDVSNTYKDNSCPPTQGGNSNSVSDHMAPTTSVTPSVVSVTEDEGFCTTWRFVADRNDFPISFTIECFKRYC